MARFTHGAWVARIYPDYTHEIIAETQYLSIASKLARLIQEEEHKKPEDERYMYAAYGAEGINVYPVIYGEAENG